MGHDYTKRIDGADEISAESSSLNLYDSSGQFVANVPMLPFKYPPKIVTWGSRTFAAVEYCKTGGSIKHYDSSGELDMTCEVQYREEYNYYIPGDGDPTRIGLAGKLRVLATAAKEFMFEPENWENYEMLQTSNSAAVPPEFMNLGEAVEELFGKPVYEEPTAIEPPTVTPCNFIPPGRVCDICGAEGNNGGHFTDCPAYVKPEGE